MENSEFIESAENSHLKTAKEVDQIPSSPDSPPWNSFIALVVWIVSVLAIFIFPLVFVVPYLLYSRINLADQEQLVRFVKTDTAAVLLQILAIIPAHIVTLVFAYMVVTHARKFDFRETLGWRGGGVLWWHYAAILIGFFALAFTVIHYFPEKDNELLQILRSSRAAVFAVAFMATFTAPIVEEVIYRGVLYSAFQRTAGKIAAIAAVTILFAMIHVPQYYPSLSTIFLLTLLSLILTTLRAATGNLLPCIILHTIFNAIQSLLLILGPYLPGEEPKVADPAILLQLLK
ncbi:MAG: CPBP family intramembrane metalloprotease [Acidobacteria bacterium]|nr:CPBP family intramembrane metalloprotease [Acidobacteriota bacterium]MCA1608329.1 CPBP family intramembrane metalloprotease [Acidobacteriota bacterium]